MVGVVYYITGMNTVTHRVRKLIRFDQFTVAVLWRPKNRFYPVS